jgi:hypothetical protein
MFDVLSQSPLAVLSLLQASTYLAAAAFARREDHDRLIHCYLASALVNALFGACYAMHIG